MHRCDDRFRCTRNCGNKPGLRRSSKIARIARLEARRDDDAVDELAQLEARSLGIAGRKRFRELLDRVEKDGDSSRMQGGDVRRSILLETPFSRAFCCAGRL
jgi:hypothetical protein